MHSTIAKPEKFSIWDDIKRNDRAYSMAVSACWGGVFLGWTIGMIGGILPRESFKKSFGLGDDPTTYANLTGWIVVIGQLGCCVGALVTAHLSDHYGRKKSLVIGAIIFLFGSILQINPTLYSSTPRSALTNLNIGRAIGGLGVGITGSVVPSYISESSPRHLRGRLTGMYQLFAARIFPSVCGIAGSFWVNYGLLRRFGDDPDRPELWQIAFGIQVIPACLLLYSIASQYESPRWLAEQGRFDEARHVIAHIRGVGSDDAEVQDEIQAIKKDVQGRTKLSIREQAKEATSSRKMLYRCSIPIILMAFQQLTGVNAVNYYSPTIFKELGLGGASAGLLGTGIYGIVKIIATILALVLGVEQWGRKAMLVWGGLGQAACMLFIGGYLFFHGDGGLSIASYFAILTLYLYIISFSFGWSVAPWPAMAESVPNHLRSLTMALGMVSNWFFNILISKATPILLNSIPWGTFVIFGITTLCAVAWAMLLFPETGGYAIEDIHKLFEDVIKQSLHDNRWLLQRPPPRKQREPEDEVEAAAGRGSMDSLRSVDRFLDEEERP
ncbi:hypothetical protein FRC05_002565 [Tulasnella sp. 425]|nr:hypothetical protein FRC05_002565 [Tulasnella sp. 425]